MNRTNSIQNPAANNKRTTIIVISVIAVLLACWGGLRFAEMVQAKKTMSTFIVYKSEAEATAMLKQNPKDTKALETLAQVEWKRFRMSTSREEKNAALLRRHEYFKQKYAIDSANISFVDQYAESLCVLKRYSEAVPLLEKVAQSDTVYSEGAASMLKKIKARGYTANSDAPRQ